MAPGWAFPPGRGDGVAPERLVRGPSLPAPANLPRGGQCPAAEKAWSQISERPCSPSGARNVREWQSEQQQPGGLQGPGHLVLSPALGSGTKEVSGFPFPVRSPDQRGCLTHPVSHSAGAGAGLKAGEACFQSHAGAAFRDLGQRKSRRRRSPIISLFRHDSISLCFLSWSLYSLLFRNCGYIV